MNEEHIKLNKEQLEKIKKQLEEKGYDQDKIDRLIKEIGKRGVVKQTQDGCDHPALIHVLGSYYQCSNCNYIFHFIEAEVYQPDAFFEESLKVMKQINGVEKWQKKYLK